MAPMATLSDFLISQNPPKLEDFRIICRVCLKKSDENFKIQPIRAYQDKTTPNKFQDLSNKIKRCSNVNTNTDIDDILPSCICDNCYNLLVIADHFRRLSTTSDGILKRIVNNTKQSSGEEFPVLIKEESDYSDGYDGGDVHFDPVEIPPLLNTYDPLDPLEHAVSTNRRKFVQLQIECSVKKTTKSKYRKSRSTQNSFHNEEDELTLSQVKEEIKLAESLQHRELTTNIGISKIKEFVEDSKLTTKLEKCVLIKEETKLIENEKVPKLKKSSKSLEKKKNIKSVKKEKSLKSFRTAVAPKPPKELKGAKVKIKVEKPTLSTKIVKESKEIKPGGKSNETNYEAEHFKPILESMFMCDHCDYFGDSRSKIFSHIYNRHMGKRFPCEICGVAFSRRHRLTKHKFIHTNEKRWKCNYCPFATNHRGSLRFHTTSHTQEKKFSCEICGKGFAASGTYQSHIKWKHAAREFQCEYCKKMFVEKRVLQDHVKCVHLGVKEQVCKECGKAYGRQRNLRNHLLKIHNIVIERKRPKIEVINKDALKKT